MARVWIDADDFRCCGEPFDVGSTVTWDVEELHGSFHWGALEPAVVASATHRLQLHPGSDEEFTGTVRGITAVSAVSFTDPSDRLDGTGVRFESQTVHRVDRYPATESQALKVHGYLVDLEYPS